MNRSPQPYKELFPIGTVVRVADRSCLERFASDWKSHHPMEPDQLPLAGSVATVTKVSYYHGGDVLYELEGVPGIWHEPCIVGI
jgi:hypothetical protein